MKKILVLARDDHTEAMRVAAGITIADHEVRLVLMDRVLAETAENALQVETLDFAGVAPETSVAAMAEDLPLLDAAGLAAAIAAADHVISL